MAIHPRTGEFFFDVRLTPKDVAHFTELLNLFEEHVGVSAEDRYTFTKAEQLLQKMDKTCTAEFQKDLSKDLEGALNSVVLP